MKMLDVNDEAESKQLEDEKFQLEDGRTYPIFTQCGTDKDQINCNICDLLIPRNTRDALKHAASHAASLGHQHRLHDVKLATTTLLTCVKEYGLVIPANDSVGVDEDEIPPGCEELRSWSHSTSKISSYLKSHYKSAFIGLEYVVEVNPDRGMSCTSHSFYICILCEKRCENLDNILKHIQSSAHRILYLKKYFPRAHSLFLQADPRVENWPPKIHEYLETIASRIETFNGRLQILSCHRTQWEVKSQFFRTKIDLGIHFRETPDLLYDDIGSPFPETKSRKCAKDGKAEFSIALRLGSGLTENAEMEKADKCALRIEKSHAAIAIDEAITLSSDESVFETDGETCKKRIGVADLRVPSSTSSCRTTWCEKAKPLNVQAQSVPRDKHESSVKIPVCQSSECDEVVIVEEEILQKDVESASNALNRVVPRSVSRRHSRSPKRLRSVCSSMSRDTVSRSRSPSPKRLRSSHSSSGRSQSRRQNAEMQQSSTSDARFEYDKERHEDLVRRCDRSRQTPEKQRKENKNNKKKKTATKTTREIRLMEKVEQKLNAFKEALSRKQQIYKERPQDHPLYTIEWKIFWKRRFSEVEKQGKNPYMHDFKREWCKFWFKRMKRLDKKEIEAKKTELMRKYRLTDDETDGDNTLKDKASDSNSEGQRRLQFGWKKISNETKPTGVKNGMDCEGSKIKNLPPNLQQPTKSPAVVDHSLESSSFEELRILHKSKDISVVGGSTSHSANDWISSDPTLLQVLRMLVALEDSLGSLGPSITKLLTRALSAERSRAGSSSQLLQENATFVVDLLDTSKEKLKVLVCTGILEGVKATAASQAIESVTRFLEQSVPLLNSGQTTNGPASFDIASLINNLREAGLLHPIPSDTVIPTTPSAVQTSKIDKPEEIPSTYSSDFIVGAPSLLQEDTGSSSSQEDESQFGSFDQFTGEELKILIVNFRTLTPSQKRDLIHCLRHVEERYADKNPMHQSQSVSSTSISPSSPLPKKHRTYKNDKPIHSYSSEVRYPSILKLTGLSSVDLENYGIPLRQLELIRPPVNPNFARKTEEQVASTNLRPAQFNSVHQPSRIGQSHHWTLSEGGSGTLTRLSMETQSTRKDGNDWNELTPDQPILRKFDRREDGSFCNVLLDPRRNRARQVKQPSLIPELSHSIGKYHDPIIIPISPVLSRRSQRNGMRQSLSDSRPSSSSSETSNPLPDTGNRYW